VTVSASIASAVTASLSRLRLAFWRALMLR
jgi:hypothetical protein